MKRRILLVDDNLAVLLTLKAVLELHGFEVETASSKTEAFARMESGVYHMVISDLRMETEDAGLEVIRAAHRQHYVPATALLTAFPPTEEQLASHPPLENQPDSMLVKPLGTRELIRQIEALLIHHADRQHLKKGSSPDAQIQRRSAG